MQGSYTTGENAFLLQENLTKRLHLFNIPQDEELGNLTHETSRFYYYFILFFKDSVDSQVRKVHQVSKGSLEDQDPRASLDTQEYLDFQVKPMFKKKTGMM